MEKAIYNIEPYISNLEEFDFDFFCKKKIENPNFHQQKFENDLQFFLKTDKQVCLTNSGTSAIHLALLSSGIQKGDVVICSSSSFVASVNPILYVGAIPYFVDVDINSGNIKLSYLEQAIKDCISKKINVKAVIITHSYGLPVDLDPIIDLKSKYDFTLIEDAAEALGSVYKKSYCGTICDYGILSFNTNKINTTLGGGALIVKDKLEKTKILKLASQNKIINEDFKHDGLGYNYRMNDFAAYIASLQIKKITQELSLKKRIYDSYNRVFEDFDFCSLLPTKTRNIELPNRWMNCLVFNEDSIKIKVEELLKKNNIEIRSLWFPLHKQGYLKDFLYIGNKESEYLFNNGICLPSGVKINEELIKMIISLIKSVKTCNSDNQ